MGLAPGPFEMTRTQVEMGHSLTVFCGAHPSGRREPVPGARVLVVPRAVKGILLFTSAPVLLIRFLWYQSRHPVDIIHGHAHVTQWFNLWRLIFGGKCPYFYHMHVTFAGREKAMLARGHRYTAIERFSNRVGKICDAWGARAADHIFVTNESVKEEAVSLIGVSPDRITVIKNGVNTSLFRPAPKDPALLARLGLGPAPGDTVVLYAGVLNQRKNIGALLEALARLPDGFKLILAGDGPAEYIRDLKERARGLGIGERVAFAGYVAYPELPPYYYACDLFVLPSLYEGMPKVLLESLASGKPSIIHSGYGLDAGLEPFVDKADCTDAAALAACMARAAERGFKGDHADFLEKFSWRSIMDRMDGVYARFLPGKVRA